MSPREAGARWICRVDLTLHVRIALATRFAALQCVDTAGNAVENSADAACGTCGPAQPHRPPTWLRRFSPAAPAQTTFRRASWDRRAVPPPKGIEYNVRSQWSV